MTKALVIDDSSTVRSIISRFLKKWNISVVQASNGAEALKLLDQNPDVQLALVDWNMPIMNGLQFVQAVRAMPNYGALKLVMVTTETETNQIVAALDAGIDEYVMKPFSEEMLFEKLSLVGISLETSQS